MATSPKVIQYDQVRSCGTSRSRLVDKQEKKVVVVDVAIPSDSTIRRKQQEELEKYQVLEEELERMRGVKASAVPVVRGEFGAVTPKLGDKFQQIPGIPPETFVQKSTFLGACTRPSGSQASDGGPELEGDTRPPTESQWGFSFFSLLLYI